MEETNYVLKPFNSIFTSFLVEQFLLVFNTRKKPLDRSFYFLFFAAICLNVAAIYIISCIFPVQLISSTLTATAS